MIKNDDTIAGFFPATVMPDPDWWRVLWPHPEEVVAALGVRHDTEAVDLCCGDGLFTIPLALSTSHVIGIDIDSGMLALTQNRALAAGATTCELVEGNAYALAELILRPVDFVLIANTFHGVPDKRRLALAVAAVLKPDGRFAIVNWHQRSREETTVLGLPRGPRTELRMTPADTAATVEPARFKQIHLVDLPPYHYGAVFAKGAK
jgi:ubiquinone/menaquinone biosynthesis C-methylase UbiE